MTNIRLVHAFVVAGVLTCGCASSNLPQVNHARISSATLASGTSGTYAVILCAGPCTFTDTGSIVARGRIVLLDSEYTTLADTLRHLYQYCEGCSDESFSHVRICYAFTRFKRDTLERLGPYARGFSKLTRDSTDDSLYFSLGQTSDAGYAATVVVSNASMEGTATGWGGKQTMFYSTTENGHRTIRRATKDELRRTAYPTDILLGKRVADADPGLCLAAE